MTACANLPGVLRNILAQQLTDPARPEANLQKAATTRNYPSITNSSITHASAMSSISLDQSTGIKGSCVRDRDLELVSES